MARTTPPLAYLVFVFVLLSYSCTEGASLQDDFNDNVLNPNLWQFTVGDNQKELVVDEIGQRLQIALGSGEGGAGIVSRCSVGGDFDVQVDYGLLVWPSNNHRHGLRLSPLDLGVGSFGLIGIYRNDSPQGLEFYTVLFGGSAQQVVTTDTAGKIRLVRAGSTLTGFFNNGAGWVSVGNGTVGTGPTRFLLDNSSAFAEALPVTTIFDNFSINSGVVTCPPPLRLADVIRNAVTVDLSIPGAIVATFRPNLGLTIRQTAWLGGYDHFNWLNRVTADTQALFCPLPPATGLVDRLGVCPVLPYIDPPRGGYLYQVVDCSNVQPGLCFFPVADELSWYLDEEFTEALVRGHPTQLEGARTARTLQFIDAPSTALGANVSFKTSLAGVRQDGRGDILSVEGTAFAWEFVGRLGGPGVIERRSTLDPALGSGEVVSSQFLVPDALTREEAQLLKVNGIGVRSAADPLFCHRIKEARNSPPFGKIRGVDLEDELRAVIVDIRRPAILCGPASLDGAVVGDVALYHEGYEVNLTTTRPRQKPERLRGLEILTRFGALKVDVGGLEHLLVPTGVGIAEPPSLPSNGTRDPYACYTLSLHKDSKPFERIRDVQVDDQLGEARLFDLKRPQQFCLATSKASAGTLNPGRSFLCYEVVASSKRPRSPKTTGIQTNNEFGLGQVDTVDEDMLCVPASVSAD